MSYENELREIISKIINITEPIDDVPIDLNLQSIGMDSLTFVQLIIAIEDSFNIEIPEDRLTMLELGTIKKLCSMVSLITSDRENKNFLEIA